MKINKFVSVYKNANYGNCDCTNGGVTSRHNCFILFWDCTKEEAQKYCDENGIEKDSALFFRRRYLWGEDHSFVEPVKDFSGFQMFGGNFVYSSDGNFPKICTTNSPLPVHDRFESKEEYDFYSS